MRQRFLTGKGNDLILQSIRAPNTEAKELEEQIGKKVVKISGKQ